ncbi:MAG TPA: CCA tRNA nucleotidyltransferase [Thermoplasmata archaeon]|nr:CCA tRNA nucleotidyltransferase [Thermoplasmata archaeon]
MGATPVQPSRAAAQRVEASVAARVAPSAEFLSRVARVRTELVARAEAAAHARSSPLVRAIVAGSAARGTFLFDRLDVDLFLLFPPDLPKEKLREEGLALGRAILTDTETRYAEHPYLRGVFEGFRVDAVPGFAIEDPSRPISPVDRTPFHQEYLARRETPELVSEVRLAKQFLRTLGIYGSESRTEGLSGYLVELLTLRFGSFHRWMEAAQGWRIPVRLAEAGAEPPRLPDDVALVLADPVDPHRNVSSALSRRNLGVLIVAAREYLARPDESWFEPRASSPLSLESAKALVHERASHVTVLELPRPDLVDDTLYPQIRKAERAVAEEVGRSGFELLGSASAADPAHVVVVVEIAHARRGAVRQRDGPPAGIDRVGEFLEKWTQDGMGVLQGPYVRPDGSLAVESREELRDVEAVVRERLPRLSLGKDLAAPRPDSVTVRPLGESTDSEALGIALRELLEKRLPWLGRSPDASTRR